MPRVPRIAALFLTLVAVAHAARVIGGLSVVIDGMVVPMWASGLAVVITGGLAVALLRDDLGRGHGVG